MAIAEARARLTGDNLRVEAGGTTESLVEVNSTVDVEHDSFEEYVIQVHGLPNRWYSLSKERLRVAAGKSAQALLVIHPPYEDPTRSLGEYQFTVDLQPADGSATIRLAARVDVLAPGATTRQSHLLQYLPALYQKDEFLARFLLIYQSILDPIEETIDNTHHYFDPGTTPASFLPWLASWVGLELEPGLSEATQRELIRRAVELSRWKGTRRGLREELKIRTGARALIVENFDGMRLGQDASLGLNTHLGVRCDQFVAVTLATDGGGATRQHDADRIVQDVKPAHVGHLVRIVPAPRNSKGGDHG